jgi:hypothetical protein
LRGRLGEWGEFGHDGDFLRCSVDRSGSLIEW